MVGEPVKQSAGEPLGAEHVGPLVEGQVGGDQDGAPFVALAEDLEEEFRTGGGEGDEAQLVDDEKPEAGQLPLQVEQPSPSLFNKWNRASMALAPFAGHRWPRSLAGKPLAGFRATPDRRIIVLFGMIVSVIRFKNPLLHRQSSLRKRRLGENRGFRPSF